MSKYALVSTVEQVETNIETLYKTLENLPPAADRTAAEADIVQALPRARQWVAVRHGDDWRVGFAKFVGHADIDAEGYSKYRKTRDSTRLDGTKADHAIKQFSGKSYAIGFNAEGPRNHPATDAVRNICRVFGKEANAVAQVYVLDEQMSEADREKVDMLLASLGVANLSTAALEELGTRVIELSGRRETV